jgi:hypothetical protein
VNRVPLGRNIVNIEETEWDIISAVLDFILAQVDAPAELAEPN